MIRSPGASPLSLKFPLWLNIIFNYFLGHSYILTIINPPGYLDFFSSFLEMDAVCLALWTWCLYHRPWAPTFRADHLHYHRSLSIVHKALACTGCTFPWSRPRHASRSLAQGTYAFLKKYLFFLWKIFFLFQWQLP